MRRQIALAYIAANVFLFILGIVFTPVFASVLRLKKKHLIPIVTLLSVIGVFAIQSSTFDLWIMLAFGVIGYVLRKFDYPLAPLVIGAVLGPICENIFRRSLVISADDYGIFIDHPCAVRARHHLHHPAEQEPQLSQTRQRDVNVVRS